MEKIFLSLIGPLFVKMGIFDHFTEEELEKMRMKNEVDGVYEKKNYNFSPRQYGEFLSYSLEKIILMSSEGYEEALKFIEKFSPDMNDTLINRAVLNALSLEDIDDKKIDVLFGMLRNLVIKPGSLVAFDILSKYIIESFDADIVRAPEVTERNIIGAKILAEKLAININLFDCCFKEIAEEYRLGNHFSNAEVITKHLRGLL